MEAGYKERGGGGAQGIVDVVGRGYAMEVGYKVSGRGQ